MIDVCSQQIQLYITSVYHTLSHLAKPHTVQHGTASLCRKEGDVQPR